MSNNTIVVTGATGQQGGAVARQLLAQGWPIRALVRDPSKPAALALAGLGVELAQGDYDDRGSLNRALAGAYGVFSVQTPFAEWGPAGETRQGQQIADASLAAGVRHFVYTSVGGANRGTGIPHFESKWRVEQHIATIGLPATVLRPVFFMENFGAFMRPQQDQAGQLTLALALRANKALQLIAASDIGAFAALAFAAPDRFVGQAIEIAGDELTPPQITAAMGKAAGRPIAFAELPIEALGSFDEDSARMFAWFNESGYAADIPALRELHPGLQDFASWLRATAWQV